MCPNSSNDTVPTRTASSTIERSSTSSYGAAGGPPASSTTAWVTSRGPGSGRVGGRSEPSAAAASTTDAITRESRVAEATVSCGAA